MGSQIRKCSLCTEQEQLILVGVVVIHHTLGYSMLPAAAAIVLCEKAHYLIAIDFQA